MTIALFQLVQIVYWLALSIWLGGLLFVAVAAPVIFRTVRDNDPTLPMVLSVNLEGQHSTLLAGTIVSNLIAMLWRWELGCAALILIAMIVQLAAGWQDWTTGIPRALMFVGAVVFTIYSWRFVWPSINDARREYIDHADEPDVANPARDQFDRRHRESVLMIWIVLALLLGMVIFSTNITAGHMFVAR